MEPEYKKKIDDMFELVKETNEHVKKIRSVQKTSQIFKIVYWVFILIVMFGGFVFVQPYVENMMNLYNGGIGALKSVQDLQGSVGVIKK